jgi:hypothetical protein
MTSLQEYDLEVVPAQIVRGQGLCKLVVDSVEKSENQITTSAANLYNETQIRCTQTVSNSWYYDIIFYLLHRTAPRNLDKKNRIELRIKYTSFQLINDIFFRKKIDGVFLYFLEKEESEKVLAKLHSDDVGVHFGGYTTTQKVLRAGYY